MSGIAPVGGRGRSSSGGVSRIPIPSFSFRSTIVEEEELPLTKQQSILQLETALQLHFVKSGTQIITYRSFGALVAKIPTPPVVVTPPSTAATAAGSDNGGLLDLSKAERLWHDLYCVAVPVLYTASLLRNEGQTDEKDGSHSLVLHRVDPIVSSQRLHHHQQKGSNSTHRWKELRRLLQETSTTSLSYRQASRKALDLLHSVRRSVVPLNIQEPSQLQSNTKESMTMTTKQSINTINTQTTLEERVTAKAKKREEALQMVQDGTKDSKEDRLMVADALFYHARHVLRRRDRSSSKGISALFQKQPGGQKTSHSSSTDTTTTAAPAATTTTTKPNNTRCVVTFKEVVQILANQRSRQEVTRILVQISKITPEWIHWTDPERGVYGVPISKTATVSIVTTNYKDVRSRLAGDMTGVPSSTLSAPMPPTVQVQDDGPPEGQASTTATATATATLEEGGKEESPLPVAVAILFDEKCTAKEERLTSSSMSPKKQRTSTPTNTDQPLSIPLEHTELVLPSTTDKVPVGPTSAGTTNAVSNPVNGNDYNNTNKKRPLEEEVIYNGGTTLSSSTSCSSPSSKKRRALRINPNFILCEDDYHGGGVIEPSTGNNDAPRGLKKLFQQLNSGQRI